MNRRIVYLMSGAAHCPYLVASLYTLRRWWDGEVSVYAWPESYPIVRLIDEDRQLCIKPVEREPRHRGRNAQFLDKIRLMQTLEPGVNLYLDADTTIHSPLDPLFEFGERFGFAATQFNNWLSTGSITRNRIRRLRKFPEIDQDLVEEVLTEPWPSVNGGVFCCSPDSPVIPLWERWTVEALSIFIADEAVLHLMQPRFAPHKKIITVLGGRFNCSPMRFQPKDLPDEDVAIRHYHGDSNVRYNEAEKKFKSEKGCKLWWPIYQECLQENVGGMAEWRGEVGNKYLDRLEQSGVMEVDQ